ncbi:MAG TPA: IS110 family transposase [Candidatus Binataceae bacterium]|nr:IS110 family transposase [Candidatus Binataceae bacterium]
MQVTTVGIDLAKNVFRVHGVDAGGKPVLRKKVSRGQLLKLLANLAPCLVGMEACGGAHYWGREIEQLGHQVRLINPRFITPYLKGNKNDANDAEAICEAVARPSMRFVALKSRAQQDALSVHRVRSLLQRQRGALMNQMRGLLAECGVVVAKGPAALRRALPLILGERAETLSAWMRELVLEMSERLRFLEQRLADYDRRIERLARSSAPAGRLMEVAGVGPLTATALIAAVGNAQQFKSGRQLSAWLGLVPAQRSSGQRTVLLGISKRGDRYLRTLLIHGARSALRYSGGKRDRLSCWADALRQRRGYNLAAVALANKNARVLWALLTRGEAYRVGGTRDSASHPSAPPRLRAAG